MAGMAIDGAPATYDDLRAVYVNCTLKRSPATSHTQHLLDQSATVMERAGASVSHVRLVDHRVAFGMSPDMSEVPADEGGVDVDEWPPIEQLILDADILVVGTPIWLGEKSSVATLLIERLYSWSSEKNDKGQYLYYGKTGGAVVTGNEDGVKHCAMNILYSLQHLGYVIPPQADAGWIGEAGPGPSYLDPGSGGPENEFTNRNVTFMSWNLLHLARLITDAGGIPAHGNQRSEWDAGCRFDFPNPEHR
jgi:multimeric flavodoxin WrbA